MKLVLPLVLSCAVLALSACSSSDDDDDAVVDTGDGDAVSSAGTFQVTFTNVTAGQLMTPPVAALHDPSVNLFVIGETSSDAIRDIAETGNSDALVAFAGDNPEVVSAAAVVGAGPFAAGGQVTVELVTSEPGQVFSAVNMIICTNDGISGVDSFELPEGNDPVTINAVGYDAGTRMNQPDALTFFPPPCAPGDEVVEAPLDDPRLPIAAHPGQSGLANVTEGMNWDFAAGDVVMTIEITRTATITP